jgi:hypothetical protein
MVVRIPSGYHDVGAFFRVSSIMRRILADALGVSPQTVMRDWKLARAWLAVELRSSGM